MSVLGTLKVRLLNQLDSIGRQQNPEHGIFRNIPEHSGTFRNIPEHPGTFRNIPEHPGTGQIITK